MWGFVEVDHSDSESPFTQTASIFSVTEGSFEFDGEYDAFDALAGGREAKTSPEDRDPGRQPLIKPRGMPNPRSVAVAWSYFKIVAEPSNLPNYRFWPSHRCVTPAIADQWVREQGSELSAVIQWFNVPPNKGTRRPSGETELEWPAVSEPHYHSASWLHLDEFDAALEHHRLKLADLPLGFSIVRNAMALATERYAADRVRIVIWFD